MIQDVSDKASLLGIENNIIITGWRNDLADIMKISEVFVFPRVEHPKEGLGLVVVEAQAAGLPMVLSNGIVADAVEIEELVHFVPLNNNPTAWADVIIRSNKILSSSQALIRMKKSKFSLSIATQNLFALYA